MRKSQNISVWVIVVLLGAATFGSSACGPNMQSVGIDLRHRLLLLEPGLGDIGGLRPGHGGQSVHRGGF